MGNPSPLIVGVYGLKDRGSCGKQALPLSYSELFLAGSITQRCLISWERTAPVVSFSQVPA